MGAFNSVSTTAICPRCGESVDMKVQFKYGATWQYEYVVGDELRWGRNDVGSRGAYRVVIDGVAEGPCPNCGYDGDWDFYVYVEQDKISEVRPASGLHDFVKEGSNYIVLAQ